MNEKDYAKLVKEYEKLHAAEPEEYIMDMNEEFEGLLEFVDDEFRSFSMEKQIEIMIKWIDMESTRQFKYYTAFKNRSMEIFRNASKKLCRLKTGLPTTDFRPAPVS